jgi:hypothetical protein
LIASFALAFLVAASLGLRVNVAGLAIGSVVALAVASLTAGSLAGFAAVLGLQAGYLAGHAGLVLQDGLIRPTASARRRPGR